MVSDVFGGRLDRMQSTFVTLGLAGNNWKRCQQYERMKVGDRIMIQDSIKGTLTSVPVYKSTSRWGLFFANIKWDDGTTTRDFMICRTDLLWMES